MSTLLADLSVTGRTEFSTSGTDFEPGMSVTASIASQDLLPDLPAPKLILSPPVRELLLDTPATLYPDEHGINCV
jgi:hypothetical protein